MAEARLRQEHPDTLQGLTLGAVRRREAGGPADSAPASSAASGIGSPASTEGRERLAAAAASVRAVPLRFGIGTNRSVLRNTWRHALNTVVSAERPRPRRSWHWNADSGAPRKAGAAGGLARRERRGERVGCEERAKRVGGRPRARARGRRRRVPAERGRGADDVRDWAATILGRRRRAGGRVWKI